jgi:hypothetical protein
MNYSFISPGSVVKQEQGKLFLDVGNDLVNGIIDHHQLVETDYCATSLVLKYVELIHDNTKEIVLHSNPDLDCVASSFLANYYLNNHKFPSFAKELASFVDLVDFGRSGNSIVNLASIFSFLKREQDNDEEVVLLGHKLIEELSSYGFDSHYLPDKFQSISIKIEDDYRTYLLDLENSKTLKAKFPYKNRSGFKECIGLYLNKPNSVLFKEWVRNDTAHSKKDRGFDFLITEWNERRFVISVEPDDEIYLKGIGDTLNQQESLKRSSLGIILDEKNRVGYKIADPWYDGRAHGYTIIDVPRRGTELVFNEVLCALNIET